MPWGGNTCWSALYALKSKRSFEEVVSSQLWGPVQLGSHPPPGGHQALGEQGKVGWHGAASSTGTRAEDPSFLCSGVSTGKIMHQWCCDTRLEDYETFLHALMVSLMKGKRFNEEEKNLLRVLCLYLLLKAEYLLTVVEFCDSGKASNNDD